MVWRYYVTDNRTHYHLGYNLLIIGESSDSKQQFTVAISEKQHLKGLFRSWDIVEGTAKTIAILAGEDLDKLWNDYGKILLDDNYEYKI